MTAILTLTTAISAALLLVASSLFYAANKRARRSEREAARAKRDQIEAERLLAEEQRAFLATLEASQHGVLITDPDNKILSINSRFASYLGVSSRDRLIGTQMAALARIARRHVVDPEPLSELTAVSGNETIRIELQTVRLEQPKLSWSNPHRSRETDKTQTGRLTLVRDRTRLLETQRELRQARALETIATLAGGVAHDFNNKLTTILGNTRQVRELAAEREAQWHAQARRYSRRSGRLTTESIPRHPLDSAIRP